MAATNIQAYVVFKRGKKILQQHKFKRIDILHTFPTKDNPAEPIALEKIKQYDKTCTALFVGELE